MRREIYRTTSRAPTRRRAPLDLSTARAGTACGFQGGAR